jgi:hypothetical protein
MLAVQTKAVPSYHVFVDMLLQSRESQTKYDRLDTKCCILAIEICWKKSTDDVVSSEEKDAKSNYNLLNGATRLSPYTWSPIPRPAWLSFVMSPEDKDAKSNYNLLNGATRSSPYPWSPFSRPAWPSFPSCFIQIPCRNRSIHKKKNAHIVQNRSIPK